MADRLLTKHFRESEFIGIGGCARLADDDRRALQFLCRFYLEPLRRAFGAVTIHSGCRSEAHNELVGGAPNSYHLYSRRRGRAAVDFSALTGRPEQWYDAIDQMWPRAGGLILYPTHVHIDNRVGVIWRDRNGGR